MTESLESQLDADSSALQQLKQILKESGYCEAGIAPTLCDVALALTEESPPNRLNTLLRLFHLQEPVGTEDATKALHPLTIEGIVGAGFIRMDGENVRANVLVQPYQDLLFAIDVAPETQPENELMRISGTSLLAAHLMVRRPSRQSLDLGTGCGFLAALLAQHSEHVYAVDLNPLAVKFADFNCRWNGLRNVTCLEGNLSAPVRDQRFDQIVCNPPFKICPFPNASANQIKFRHSGQEGDQFCINLAWEASHLLHEDGYFQMPFEWFEVDGEDWAARLTKSFSGTGCDVWGLRVCQTTADVYVSDWLADLEGTQELPAEAHQEGVLYFRHKKVNSIGTGLLTMRRCSSRPNFLWFDEAPEDLSEPYGESIAGLFDVRMRLGNSSDDVMLEEKFTASPNIGMIQKARLTNGHWEATASELIRELGLKYCFSEVSPQLLRLVALLDGDCTLRQIFERLAREEKVPLTEVVGKHLPEIRELVWFGFLIPASFGKPQISN